MGLTPAFKLMVNDVDITERVAKHLQSITLVDKVGFEADTVEIQLHNANAITLPTVGARLVVYLGYRETALQQLGHYFIDEIETSGPPHQLIIRGKSADMLNSLKAPKTRAWTPLADASGHLKLADLLGVIAGEHQLTPKLSDNLQAITLQHPIQTNESDLNFLTRIANTIGATIKPAAGCLLLFTKGLAKTLSGQLLPVIDLGTERVYRWHMTQRRRDSYQQVTARYYDQHQALEKRVTAGHGAPIQVITQLFKNEQEALLAAQAKLVDIQRGERTLQIDLPGDPNLIAESKIKLTGIRPEVDGHWCIEQVVHTFSVEGYQSQVSATAA